MALTENTTAHRLKPKDKDVRTIALGSVSNNNKAATRARLTRESVIAAAVGLADVIGVDPLTIRKLATSLKVKPMAIYHHVASKNEILDGMIDAVFAEIELPPDDVGWQEGMRIRTRSARLVLARHPWAAAMMDGRVNPGLATLTHHDAVLRCLRSGLSLPMAAHAYALIDAYVFGFALQEAALPFSNEEEAAQVATAMLESFPREAFPHLAELTIEHVLQPGYNFAEEFDFGLELILSALSSATARQS
jgi:AcrR family transcriptional regulator